MDAVLFQAVEDLMPKMDERLANGFAVHQLESVEDHVDRVWRQAERNFPPCLTYDGCERITPAEEFQVVSNYIKNTKTYDISNSDVYMVRYKFSLNGKEIDDMFYLYLPYVTQGGIMTIKNSKNVLSPVMADVGLSIGSDSIFTMINRAKLTFRKAVGYMMVDGVHRSPYLITSQIYNTETKLNRNNSTTLPHYLFCKFGLIQAFQNINVTVKVIERAKYDAEQYPESDWVFCTSVGQLVSMRSTRNRKMTNLGILIPRSQYDHRVESMVASFFYVADRFPERITIHDYDDQTIWRVLLGKFIMSGEVEGKILRQIDSHMESIDGYIDEMAREQYIAGGYKNINDIYDLMYYLVDKLPSLIVNAGPTISSLYGKQLVVDRYVLEDITRGISMIYFEISNLFRNKGVLTTSELLRIFKTKLPYTTILTLNSGKAFVKSVSSASDCLLHKVTNIVTMQTECGKRPSKKGPVFGLAQHADMSTAEVGGITNLPDRDPTGRSSLNHMMKIDEHGIIRQNPKFKDIIDAAQEDIRRK